MPEPSFPIGRGNLIVNVGIRPDQYIFNPAMELTWANDELTQIDLVGHVTLRQTLTWSNDELTNVSAWAEV